jgi:rRNA maturation RNase YbeY
MKKHHLIYVDFQSTVMLTVGERKKILKWLNLSSQILPTLLVDEGAIHPRWAAETRSFRVSVLLCGKHKMRNLNLSHRGKNRATDVLSFPAHETLRCGPLGILKGPDGEVFLGDMAICYEKVNSQSKDHYITFMDEFIHLYFHGLFHLLGYDHEISAKEEKQMQSWESRALKLFSEAKKRGPRAPQKL